MSQTGHRDLEEGGDSDGHINQRRPIPNHPMQSSERESDYDSSLPLYSIYSNIAEKEDNKMVESCQRDKDGILIFTGLFSATVGALLTVSIQDLKPNPQDTSAFYLKNIYRILGNPNISDPFIPSALAEPPVFSPPRYAIWVNSLWFLSLIVSVSTAMDATIVRNWAVHYIGVTRWPWDTLSKQARIRAIFAKGNPGPYTIWGTNNTHDYLHFSVLLFIIGGLIYLFNISHDAFYAVVWWVGFFAISYTIETVGGFFEPHGLLHTPLSELALNIYLGIFYVVSQVCSYIPLLHGLRNNTRRRYRNLSNRYSDGFLVGKRRGVAEIASKPSSEIDALILERILLTLDEDCALENFFDAIPGFCNSKLSVVPLSFPVQKKLRQALDGFLDRTFSSSLISESDRTGRLVTCLNAAHMALGIDAVSRILDNLCNRHWEEAPQSVEIGHALRRWGHGRDHDLNIRRLVARIIAYAERRDDRWTMLVTETFGVPDGVLRDSLAHGDSALLSILIHISRLANRASFRSPGVLSSLSKFDIHNTLPRLQHDFCTLWNEITQEARSPGSSSTPVRILRDIRHLYVALHQGTDAAPTAFSASTDDSDRVLLHPSSYPFCNISSHRQDSTAHVPLTNSPAVSLLIHPGDSPDSPPRQSTVDPGTALQLTEGTSIITGLPSPPADPSTTSEIGGASRVPTATLPNQPGSPPSNRFPQDGVSTGQPDATSAAELYYHLELESDEPAPRAVPPAGIGRILSTVPTPVPPSTQPVLDKSSAAYDASPASISKSFVPASSSGFSAPGSPLPPHVPPLHNAKLLSLLSGMSPKGLSNESTLPHLLPRRLVNNWNMNLANTVLILLAYCPPFRDVFRDLGQLIGQREGGVTDRGVTPLMDATARFLDQFAYREKSSLTQQYLQQITRGKAKEDEEDKEENDDVDPLVPTYVYDVMKEKRQFVNVMDGQEQDAAAFLGLYLDALDEEWVVLHTSLSTHKKASIPKVEELEEETQLGEGQTEVGERDCTAISVKSPISRIFTGRSRSTIHAPNQPDTVTIEDWRSLQLDIEPDSVHAVKDALTHISQPRPVQVDRSSSSEASQQVLLEELPPVLVLQLERFPYGAVADGIVKINKPVRFSPELEISPETMAPVAGIYAEPMYYKLCGVLYHHGESAGSGHCTVDVLHSNGDSGSQEVWLQIDDEAVRAVGHDDVFGGHDNERVDARCAYMLFYCRTLSART